MYILLNILIFLIILFLYIHINFHLTTSNYLEIYEIKFLSKENFEELCNLKQPLLIKDLIFDNDNTIDDFYIDNIVNNYGNFDINLYNKENNKIPIYLELNKATNIWGAYRYNSENERIEAGSMFFRIGSITRLDIFQI